MLVLKKNPCLCRRDHFVHLVFVMLIYLSVNLFFYYICRNIYIYMYVSSTSFKEKDC